MASDSSTCVSAPSKALADGFAPEAPLASTATDVPYAMPGVDVSVKPRTGSLAKASSPKHSPISSGNNTAMPPTAHPYVSTKSGSTPRAALREIVEKGWSGSVDADSVAYRLARMFRDLISDRVIAFVLSECREADPAFDYTTVRRRDAAIWRLATQQPMHLLDPAYSSWQQMLLAAVDDVIAQATDGGRNDLSGRTWAEYNVTRYRHPLSAAIPTSSLRSVIPSVLPRSTGEAQPTGTSPLPL